MDLPVRPNDSDCCGSGCNPCIFDVYEEQMRRYEAARKRGDALKSPEKNCISQTCYTEFRLVDRKTHTKNTVLLSFRCENNGGVGLHYSAGQHFLLRSECEKFTRAYTPIPPQPDAFSFTTLVKLYDNGMMSNYLKKLSLNSLTLWRGPYGAYVINFDYNHVLGIAQGTGVAPIYAVFSVIVENQDCESFLHLFCCYRDSDDILLHDELYALSSNWNFAYDVFLSCDVSPKNVKYNEMVHSRRLCDYDVAGYFLGKDVRNVQVLICGTKQFCEHWMEIVKGCNVQEGNIFVF